MVMFITGFITSLILIGVIFWIFMPYMGKLFFVEKKSKLNFQDTIDTIRNKIENNSYGWFISQEKHFHKVYEKQDKEKLDFKLTEFKVGNPNHSHIVNSSFPALSTFMPAAIAIVEFAEDDVRIYVKNTGLLGKFFKGKVRDVMCNTVPPQMNAILKDTL
jgi:uncharacterized protein (DUF302 family)